MTHSVATVQPSNRLEVQDEFHKAEAVVNRLSPIERASITRSIMRGESFAEIGKTYRFTRQRIEQVQKRAFQTVREELSVA